MEATNVTSCGIVHEVLTKDNYETWKVLMKNYLLGENLWDVVQSGSVSTDDQNQRMNESGSVSTDDQNRRMNESGSVSTDNQNRKRMNAKALHIIQLSCGSKIFEQISRFETAQEAWNDLGARYGSKFIAKADIEQGVVDDNLLDYKALYEYLEKADSSLTKAYIRDKTDAIFSASASGRTVLHTATIVGDSNIVKDLVNVGKDKLVEKQDKEGYTALALAAHYTGNIVIAKCMVEKKGRRVVRENLLSIKNEYGEIPLLLAADKGHKEMTRYLYDKTPKNVLNRQDTRNRVLLLERCIKAEIFDVALGILESYPELPSESLSYGHRFRALRELAQMPSAFLSGCQFGLRQRVIYNSRLLREIDFVFLQISKFLNIFGIREIDELIRTHHQVEQILSCLQSSVAEFNNLQLEKAFVYEAMLEAAKHGIVEFIDAMRTANPDLLWTVDSRKRNIFSYAVLHRKKNVFQLINTLSGRKTIVKYHEDVFGNNMLHLAAHLGPSSDLNDRPGAALQMQRELQWFKAVEEVVDPKCKEARNDDDKKPHELFAETHKELVKAGEKWAKDTAGSFTLVGTLITTIMFAAAFTVPGGNDQNTGVPIFFKEKVFTAFVVADAISLFTSATSVLIFIGILTSRYAERDFLRRLPWKLLFGLFFLFLSVVSMIVAFCAALSILLKNYWAYKRIFIGCAIAGSIPVVVLVPSQLTLMYEIFRSTISNPVRISKKKI